MGLTYSRKIKVNFVKEAELILDGQSKICNWLYNQLLDACQKDYKENNNALKLLKNRNLRNYGVSLKAKHPFLNTVFSSPLKEPSTRLVNAYKGFFEGRTGYPQFRSWKKKWFSLVFDEPNKGWEILNEGKTISISLGTIPGMKIEKGKGNPSVSGTLKEKVELKKGEIIKTFTLCKQQGNQFYAIFTIERCSDQELEFKKVMSDYRKAFNLAKKEGKEKPIKPKLPEKKVNTPMNSKWIA